MHMVTFGNGSGTDFQASQCIPIQAATLALPLTLGVVIPYVFVYETDLYSKQCQ